MVSEQSGTFEEYRSARDVGTESTTQDQRGFNVVCGHWREPTKKRLTNRPSASHYVRVCVYLLTQNGMREAHTIYTIFPCMHAHERTRSLKTCERIPLDCLRVLCLRHASERGEITQFLGNQSLYA